MTDITLTTFSKHGFRVGDILYRYAWKEYETEDELLSKQGEVFEFTGVKATVEKYIESTCKGTAKIVGVVLDPLVNYYTIEIEVLTVEP